MPELAEAITSRRDLNVEAKLRAAFELSPTVLTITADGRFVDVNDAFVRLYGSARKDVIGRAVSELNRTGHGQAEDRARRSKRAWIPI
jgi:PAS domain S-box-containing protein